MSFVLITGSTGLIGRQAVEAVAHDHRVLGFDVSPPARLPEGSHFLECDLASDADVERACQEAAALVNGASITSVLHLADADAGTAPIADRGNIRVEGTRRLLRGLAALTVEQFVYASSLLAMPAGESGPPMDEAAPVSGDGDDARTRLEAEAVLKRERGAIPLVILRLAAAYDDGCHCRPIAAQIRGIYEDATSSYFISGDVSRGLPAVHVDDVIDCLLRAVSRPREIGPEGTLLIAEPDIMTYTELRNEIGMLTHRQQWPGLQVPTPVAKAGAWVREKLAGPDEDNIAPWLVDLDDARYPVAIGEAHRVLGWQPRHRLRDALPQMIARLKNDPERWYRDNRLPGPVREPNLAE